MKLLRDYGWAIPTVISMILVLTTPISPWVLGGAAVLVIALGYLVGWLVGRSRESRQGDSR